MNKDCIFCRKSTSQDILIENDLAYALLDTSPVSEGHTLIIPKRHFADYFEITHEESMAVRELMHNRKKQISEEDELVTGFNVGINCGEDAGQTILHVHIHLIPRRKGDTPQPRGGVRGVIPDKMNY